MRLPRPRRAAFQDVGKPIEGLLREPPGGSDLAAVDGQEWRCACGLVHHDVTEHIDVPATIVDILGIDRLPIQHGQSLRPYLERGSIEFFDSAPARAQP